MTVLVMDVRLQDAADRLGMEMCGEGLKIAALLLCEALLFQEPRIATPTGAVSSLHSSADFRLQLHTKKLEEMEETYVPPARECPVAQSSMSTARGT